MGNRSDSQSSQQSQSSYDPELKATQLANYASAQKVAANPVQAYTGDLSAGTNDNLTGASQSASALAQFYAPNAGVSDINRGDIANVSTGPITGSQIAAYANPYENSVVSAALNDNERQRQMAIASGQASATAAGAFGGSRHGVADSLTNEAAIRAGDATAAQLRSQGFQTALTAAQADAQRKLTADQGNQGYDYSVASTNAGAHNTASLADQRAALDAAGVRQGATSQLASLGAQEQAQQQTGLMAAYQEWLRKQNYGSTMQQLLTQAAGALPNGTTSTSTGNSKSSSTQVGPSSVSIG